VRSGRSLHQGLRTAPLISRLGRCGRIHPDVGAGWLPRCGWGWHAGSMRGCVWDLGHVCLALGPRRCAASRLERRERWQFTSMLLHIAAGAIEMPGRSLRLGERGSDLRVHVPLLVIIHIKKFTLKIFILTPGDTLAKHQHTH
jgi:hypothetical protein